VGWAVEVEAVRDLVLVGAEPVAACRVAAEEAVELARVAALVLAPEPVRWARRVRAAQEHFGKRVERRAAPVCRGLAVAVAQAAELEVEAGGPAAVWVMAVQALASLVETPLSKENG
jgi:hypothetical protein